MQTKIFDASALALEANRFFVGNAEFLQPPAKIQNLHHRMPFLVCLSGDQ